MRNDNTNILESPLSSSARTNGTVDETISDERQYEERLWTGLQPLMHRSYAAGGIMNGSFKHRGSRGSCAVLGPTPSLWPFVVRALGFDLASISTREPLFRAVVGDLQPPALEDNDAPNFQAVFGSATAFRTLPWTHWKNHRVPHVCTMTQGEALPSLEGWKAHKQCFSHSGLGGVTNGTFSLGILAPEERWNSVPNPPGFPRQASSALWNIMDSTVSATPLTAESSLDWLSRSAPSQTHPQFHRRWLDPRGIAPLQGLETMKVMSRCVFSPTKWGVRQLTAKELASVFDIPILVQDQLSGLGKDGEMLMRNLCGSHPGKVLHLGGDHLLSLFCRGGWKVGSAASSGGAQSHRATQQEALRRIREAAVEAAQRSKMDRGSQLVQGVKQEGQKADDADVPTHLWDGMWLESRREQGWASMEEWKGEPWKVDENEKLPRWRLAIETMRSRWLLLRWRRNVTSSFFGWFKNSVAIRGHLAIQPSKWVRWEENRRCRGGKGSPGYVWASRSSREEYMKAWTRERRPKGHKSILESGREAIERATSATWWGWEGGSSLFFWRWPKSHIRWAREGQPHFTTADLPNYDEPQRRAKTKDTQERMNAKVNKVRWRRYICLGPVYSLTHMFSVPKGCNDIRMVYDGTKSGLNDCLFAPHFSLPVMSHTLRSLLKGYYGADLDVGEMFLNWWLGEKLRPYAGVDVTHVKQAGEKGKCWERWVRNFMGLRDSPFRSLQMMIMAKFLAYGDRTDEDNPFRWDSVVLNLPGDPDYDPSLPWVMKVRRDGHLASEVYIYVDDGKFTGWNRLECWRAVQRFSKVLSWLGIQDAFRKRTGPSTEPGPWAGTVTHTKDGVMATVTEVKWAKTQGIVQEMAQMLEDDETALPRKALERARGFLIYVGRTFRWMNPYLKGLHLTIDSWRTDRDEEGYKKKKQRQIQANELHWKEAEEAFERGEDLELKGFEDAEKAEEAPETVEAVPRLRGDIEALVKLTAGAEPAVQECRVEGALSAVYIVGDASGKGFGSAVWDSEEVSYLAGSWNVCHEEESSNWREATNLTARVEEMAEAGKLDGKELWIFTDNSTYEGAFYKGYSESPKLTAIIFRLRRVERLTGCILHVIHISGTRMKEVGADGLSRQDFVEGIMKGESPWKYFPLNEDADLRSQGRVSKWIDMWWKDEEGEPWCAPRSKGEESAGERGRFDLTTDTKWESEELVRLEPGDWFRLHEIKGHRLWMPPPAAMETVMELFAEDHLVNPHLAHVFVVPRLMTHMWRRQMMRDADLFFYVYAGHPFWPRSMHEPLTVAVIFPLAHVPRYNGPWLVRDQPYTKQFGELLVSQYRRPKYNGREEFLDLEGEMPRLQEDDYQWTWNLLRQFLHMQRQFPPVFRGISRGLLPGLRGQPISSADHAGRRGGGRRKRIRGD